MSTAPVPAVTSKRMPAALLLAVTEPVLASQAVTSLGSGTQYCARCSTTAQQSTVAPMPMGVTMRPDFPSSTVSLGLMPTGFTSLAVPGLLAVI